MDYVIVGTADNSYNDSYCVIGIVRNGSTHDKEICKEGVIKILQLKECRAGDDTQLFVIPADHDTVDIACNLIERLEDDGIRSLVYEYEGLIKGRAKGKVFEGTDWIVSKI